MGIREFGSRKQSRGEVRLPWESGRSLPTIEVRGKIWLSDRTYQQSKLGRGSGSRKSPDGVFFRSKPRAKSGSLRSPGEVCPQLKLEAKSGPRGSPDGVYRRSKSRMKSGSRRSLDGVLSRRGRWGRSPPFSLLVLNDQTLIDEVLSLFLS